MAAKDIKDPQSLLGWLNYRTVDDASVISARMALRVVPALKEPGRPLSDSEWVPRLILTAFRACATARLVASYPNGANIGFGASIASTYASIAATRAGTAGAADTIYSASRAASRAALVAHLGLKGPSWDAPSEAADGVARASDAVSEATARAAIWSSVRADVSRLEAGVGTRELAVLPLWLDGAPPWASKEWAALKTELVSRPVGHWDVWIDWYEARLRGEPGNEDEEVARILELTDEEWDAGPAIANKKIKHIAARFRSPSETMVSPGATAATTPITPFESKSPAFLSHATRADGARALMLAHELEAAGLPCWIAPRDIPSGADWNGTIMRAIDSCDTMILLVSDAALSSPFVKAEVQHAFEKGKRVFPIRVTETAEPGQIDLRLKIVQHIDGRGEIRSVVANLLKSLG